MLIYAAIFLLGAAFAIAALVAWGLWSCSKDMEGYE